MDLQQKYPQWIYNKSTPSRSTTKVPPVDLQQKYPQWIYNKSTPSRLCDQLLRFYNKSTPTATQQKYQKYPQWIYNNKSTPSGSTTKVPPVDLQQKYPQWIYNKSTPSRSTTKVPPVDLQQKYPQWIYDLPPEKRVNAKSQFRQTAKPNRAERGILYHGEKEVLTKSQLPNIFKVCYDNPISDGHFGRDKNASQNL